MRNKLEEIEAAAAAPSMRLRNGEASSDSRLDKSLADMLNGNQHDWLIDEADLEIAVDDQGRAVQLGKGSFGTVGLHHHGTLARGFKQMPSSVLARSRDV